MSDNDFYQDDDKRLWAMPIEDRLKHAHNALREAAFSLDPDEQVSLEDRRVVYYFILNVLKLLDSHKDC